MIELVQPTDYQMAKINNNDEASAEYKSALKCLQYAQDSPDWQNHWIEKHNKLVLLAINISKYTKTPSEYYRSLEFKKKINKEMNERWKEEQRRAEADAFFHESEHCGYHGGHRITEHNI